MATDKQRDPALERAIEMAGGVANLARFINERTPERPITTQAISQWRRVPPDRVLVVEAATHERVARHELRPDIYPTEQVA